MKDPIIEVKKKREFSKLPDSIIKRALKFSNEEVKDARALLRKYFGVFLTNKVLKGKDAEILKFHKSSMKRDYEIFYKKIFERKGKINSIVDLGCGVGGFSYDYIEDILGSVNYLGIEASGQLVSKTNSFFEENKYVNAKVVQLDLFDVRSIVDILKKCKKPRVVFIFQVIDALENIKKNFSKEFIMEISNECELMVLSLPLECLGRRKRLKVQRNWIFNFLKERFLILDDFELFGERVFIFSKK